MVARILVAPKRFGTGFQFVARQHTSVSSDFQPPDHWSRRTWRPSANFWRYLICPAGHPLLKVLGREANTVPVRYLEISDRWIPGREHAQCRPNYATDWAGPNTVRESRW